MLRVEHNLKNIFFYPAVIFIEALLCSVLTLVIVIILGNVLILMFCHVDIEILIA